MREILIFGGSGLLGSNYIFHKKSKEIINFYNKKRASKVQNLKLNFNNLEKFIVKNKIRLLINFAGVSDVEKSEKNKKIAFNTNVKLPEKLALICKSTKIKFVHISTDHFLSKNILSKKLQR